MPGAPISLEPSSLDIHAVQATLQEHCIAEQLLAAVGNNCDPVEPCCTALLCPLQKPIHVLQLVLGNTAWY
jgi:hypothetical protein